MHCNGYLGFCNVNLRQFRCVGRESREQPSRCVSRDGLSCDTHRDGFLRLSRPKLSRIVMQFSRTGLFTIAMGGVRVAN